MSRLGQVLRLFAVVLLLMAPAGSKGAAAPRPRLTLKALPTVGTASTLFVFQAVLTGAEETEDFYCLSTEWIWEEQLDSSINESECPPYVPGETKIDRSFSEEQSFRALGPHVVKVVLRKGEKQIATASITVTVREGH
ncbi:MAG: hypothetical protein K1Y01_14320 [Vicinamibacteria bacterium]|nr:hypothetical protein [Vicinamibacteria bacterium]